MASYPAAPVVFPARSDGQTIYSQHINALQDEIAAIEASLLATSTGGVPSPLVVSGVRPTVLLDYTGIAAKGRLQQSSPQQTVLLHNLNNDGVNWNADDVASAGLALIMSSASQNLTYYTSAAGANPRALVQALLVEGATGGIRERARTVAMGEWINWPFNASDYAGNGTMTWTVTAGGVAGSRYMLIGKTVFFMFDISGTIGGTPSTQLIVHLPVGSVGTTTYFPLWVQNTTTLVSVGVTNAANLVIFRDTSLGTIWTAGAVHLGGMIIYNTP